MVFFEVNTIVYRLSSNTIKISIQQYCFVTGLTGFLFWHGRF